MSTPSPKPPAKPASPGPDRLPPHSIEAEQGTLGCILLSPNDCMEQFSLLVKAGCEIFYDLRHQTIFRAMLALFDAKKPIDTVSLAEVIRKTDSFEDVGGFAYLSDLTNATPTAGNLGYYVEILNEKYACRRILRTCIETVARVYDHTGSFESLLSRFETDSLAVRQSVERGLDSTDLNATLRELLLDYQDAIESGRRPGIATGFEEVDRIIGGFKPQDLVLIGASPSSGKTAFVLNIMEHAILHQGQKVGVASLETSSKKVLHRIISSVAKVNGARFLRGTANQDDLSKVIKATGKSGPITHIIQNLMVSDQGALNVAQVGAKFRRFYKEGARLFILDYLQLLSSGKNNNARRVEEMTLVSTGLKGIAKDLNCPLLVVSSINREAMKEDRKPRLSDLRDTGQLEFDADVVILLDRMDNADDIRTVNVDVAKNKEGPIGECKLNFYPPEMRFESPPNKPGDPEPEAPML